MIPIILFAIIIALLLLSIILYTIRHIKDNQRSLIYNLLEQAKVNAILLGKNNKINRISNSMCEILEVQPFELIGNHVSSIFQEADQKHIRNLLQHIDKNNLEVIENITLKTKTKEHHVLCKITSVSSLLKFHNRLVFFQDRTDIINSLEKLKKSQKTLKDYSALFKSSFDDSFLPSVIIDKDGFLINYNKSFHSLIKKKRLKAEKDSLFSTLNLSEKTLKENLNQNKCFEVTCKIENITKDLVFNIHKIKNDTESSFYLCQIQDITRQKQAEVLRKKLEQKITQTRKVEYLGELSGLISHEFNNSLMPIISFSKAVYSSLPDEFKDEKDKLNKIIEASNHAKKTINQIMEIEHIDFCDATITDLNMVIEEALRTLELKDNIKVNFDSFVESAKVNANFEVLTIAIKNIIQNSAQAINNNKGEITISIDDIVFDSSAELPKSQNKTSLERNVPYYALEIKDTGSGIKKEDLDDIFNPFFTTKHFNNQIGIGLTYVYNCMDKFNIPFVVKNSPNKGVSIIIFFKHP